MGAAGLMFEPHPPNFENLYNFKDREMLFDYCYWFQIFKNQCLSFPSISVACPWLYVLHCMHSPWCIAYQYKCTYFWTYFQSVLQVRNIGKTYTMYCNLFSISIQIFMHLRFHEIFLDRFYIQLQKNMSNERFHPSVLIAYLQNYTYD